jgi:hypothetical protein
MRKWYYSLGKQLLKICWQIPNTVEGRLLGVVPPNGWPSIFNILAPNQPLRRRKSFQLTRDKNLIDLKGFLLVNEFVIPYCQHGILSSQWGGCISLNGTWRDSFQSLNLSYLIKCKGFVLVNEIVIPHQPKGGIHFA